MTPPAASPPVSPRDHLLGALLAAGYVVWLVATAGSLGYARDEGFYVQAAEAYARWMETLVADPARALERKAIDASFGVNSEHPPLLKLLFGLSWLAQRRFHLFAEEGTSFRFPAMALAGAAVWLLYVWGARSRGRVAGLLAAGLFALMPRVFYHAHLNCFDVPIVTLYALTAYVYWRSLQRGGILWPLATGVVFGLALATKHNSWFLPIAFCAHALLGGGRDLRRGLAVGSLRVPTALFAMALVGPTILYALWPWIWFDTGSRLAGYVAFHLHHDYYNMEFLGVTYFRPPMPRLYAPLMTAVTVPGITLLLFAVGVGVWARDRLVPAAARVLRALRRAARGTAERDGPRTVREGTLPDPAHTELLWALLIVIQYAAWLSPKTPIFGGTKHWMTAYPFLCLFAASGFVAVLRAARALFPERLAKTVLPDAALTACVLASPAIQTVESHPYGLSSYTPLAGGAAGAATLGMNRTFWGYTTGSLVEYLNEKVPPGGAVYVHDTAAPSWSMLQRDGRLRRDLRMAWTPSDADVAIYHHEPHMLGVEYGVWVAYGTVRPDHLGVHQGVPVVWVYRRPTLARAP